MAPLLSKSSLSKMLSSKKFLIVLMCAMLFIGVAIYVYVAYIRPKFSNQYAANKEYIEDTGSEDNYADLYFFYTSWCPHCKTVKPEWEKLENDSNLNNITVEKVNCDKNEAAARENNIEGFPTILFTHNGKVESYEGGREYADFKQYLNSKNI